MTKETEMTTILTGQAQQRQYTTYSQAAHIAAIAALRLRDPHAAQVAELIGISVEHAAKDEFHRRLAILRDLHQNLICEQWRGRIGSWLFSPGRLEALREAIRAELERLETVEQTDADRVFADGYLPAIAASVN